MTSAGARRGRRVTLTGDPLPAPTVSSTYVVNRRPLPYGDHILPPGVEVPGAAGWPRVEAWVNARTIRAVVPGESFTSFEEWQAEQGETVPSE